MHSPPTFLLTREHFRSPTQVVTFGIKLPAGIFIRELALFFLASS